MKIRRLGHYLGAEVTGLDLTKPLDDEAVSEIREALLDHIVLCFHGQDLDPEGLIAFSGRFGKLDDNRRSPHNRHPDYPLNVGVHSNKPIVADKPVTVAEKHFGVANNWHSDRSFTNRPETMGFLFAKILPEIGGDTMFANMYMAYETLSPAFQRMIEPLAAVHDVTFVANFSREGPERQAVRRQMHPPVVHPVVRVHPETGRKALYVDARVRNFVGMTEEETKQLREYLIQHATRYEMVYRHRWGLHDLLMWDNRCAMHYAIPDYDLRQLRRMFRCSLLSPKTGYYLEPAEAAPAQLG
jgi:taurine dioxygenase